MAATSVATASTAPAVLTSVVLPVDLNATAGQLTALSKAVEYLKYAAFSVDGLIHQLEAEGISNEDASYAVFVLHLDWNDQASKRAAVYVKREPITHNDLIAALVYEGFTLDQAQFGANANGL